MRAAAFTALGGPSGVEVIELPSPTPGDGQAVVDVAGASVNRHDLLYLQGDFRLEERHLPFVSGVDMSGTVRDVGDGVEGVEPGDRVVLNPMQTCGSCRDCRDGPENLCEEYSLFHGGFAEQAVVDADRLVSVPNGVDLVTAAALPVTYMTAWHMLRRADVDAGDTVLIPGATGGVGVASTQLTDAMGIRSVCTSSSPEKLDQLSAFGADELLEAADADALGEKLEGLEPVDAVLNHLAGPFTDVCLSALRRNGRMIICGRTAEKYSEIDTQNLFLGHKRIIGSTMGTQADLERVVDLYEADAIAPPVHETYSFDDAGQAFTDMQNRDVVGNLVVTPP